MDKKKNKNPKTKPKAKPKVTIPVPKPKSRRGFSVSNIVPNLKKYYNTLTPVLNLPPLSIVKSAIDMEKLNRKKLEDKVYKKGEIISRLIWNDPNVALYGDGSGRSFKNGGYSACRSEMDGCGKFGICKAPFSNCYKEKTKQGLVFDPNKGWVRK
jgi:hypothetical protein